MQYGPGAEMSQTIYDRIRNAYPVKGTWSEQDHPRADSGQFGSGGGGAKPSAGGKPKPKPGGKPSAKPKPSAGKPKPGASGAAKPEAKPKPAGGKPAAKPKAPPKPSKAASKSAVGAAIKDPKKMTSDEVAALPGHLNNLTIPELNALKKEHGIEGKDKKKAEIVSRIQEHLKKATDKISSDGVTVDAEKIGKQIGSILDDKSSLRTSNPDRVGSDIRRLTEKMSEDQLKTLAKKIGVQDNGGSLVEQIEQHAVDATKEANKMKPPTNDRSNQGRASDRSTEGGSGIFWVIGQSLGLI